MLKFVVSCLINQSVCDKASKEAIINSRHYGEISPSTVWWTVRTGKSIFILPNGCTRRSAWPSPSIHKLFFLELQYYSQPSIILCISCITLMEFDSNRTQHPPNGDWSVFSTFLTSRSINYSSFEPRNHLLMTLSLSRPKHIGPYFDSLNYQVLCINFSRLAVLSDQTTV